MAEVKQVLYTQKHMQTHNHLVCVEQRVHVVCARADTRKHTDTHTPTAHTQAHTPRKNTDRGRQLLFESAWELQLLSTVACSSIYHLQARESYWIYKMTESETGCLFDDKPPLSNCTYLPMFFSLASGCQSYTLQPLRHVYMMNVKFVDLGIF